MRDVQAGKRSAVVFGARNLGRAVIKLLVSDGWSVTGVARSQSTLDGVSAITNAAALELRPRGVQVANSSSPHSPRTGHPELR